ncbi:premnaspirodiene oxygenase-like [Asparagus officinalis]|nr:premnaspirodiene oxygenase-like [Asparagus officinalis]
MLPIIGSMHHLIGSLPHHILRDLAKTYGPLMHLKLGEISTIVVSSKEMTREIMKDHDIKFASRPNILSAKIMLYDRRDLVFAPYGEYWRQLRKLFVVELLSAKRVQSFRSIREEEALGLMRKIGSMSPLPVNLTELLHSFGNDMTAQIAFGNKCKDVGTYLKAMKEGLELSSGFCLADLFPSSTLIRSVTRLKFKLERCHHKVDRILERIILDHKDKRGMEFKNAETLEENFLDVLFNLQAHGGLGIYLTDTNIKAIIFDVFAAGSGTTAAAMTWTMSELIQNPRVLKKAQAEVREVVGCEGKVTEDHIKKLNYLKLVVKETLRLHPSAPLLIPRECSEQCQVHGYDIPAGTRVVFNAWAMGRDPMYWDEPERFRPERFEGSSVDLKRTDFEFIPFGAGRRICPGILFGLASMELVLANLLFYFEWSLPEGIKELDMTEKFGLGARRKYDLILCATPYVSL